MNRKSDWQQRPEPRSPSESGGGKPPVKSANLPPGKARLFWAFIMIVSTVTIYFISNRICRSIVDIYELSGRELPFLSQIGVVLNFQIMRRRWWLVALACLGGTAAIAALPLEERWIFIVIGAAVIALLLPAMLALTGMIGM